MSEHGTALITGASSGIGTVYADRLARRGHDLVLVARDEQALARIAAEIAGETGRDVGVLAADLTTPGGVAAVERRLHEDASISLLVNNAGVAVLGPLAGADTGALDAMIALNVTAVTRLGAAAATAFAARGEGTIVNLSSALALLFRPGNVVYSATKAYVLAFTQALHEELAGSGVRLQAVLPGAVHTPIWSRAGVDVATFPEGILMDVGDAVDAALAGLDAGELVTIPSLPDAAEWEALDAARDALAPNLSRDRPAERYVLTSAGATPR
jgi:short-subunit dehydrogenase